MPDHVDLFYALLASALIAATIWGAAPERIGAGMLVAAMAATMLLRQDDRYLRVQWAEVAVDVALLGGLVWLSVCAKRDWPGWGAAFQLVTATAHLIKLINPGIVNTAYSIMLAISAYPTVLLVLGGVWHHQRRKRGRGYDSSWTRPPAATTWGRSGGR